MNTTNPTSNTNTSGYALPEFFTIEEGFNPRQIPDEETLMKDPSFIMLMEQICDRNGNFNPIIVHQTQKENGENVLLVTEGHRRLKAIEILNKQGRLTDKGLPFEVFYAVGQPATTEERSIIALQAGLSSKALSKHEVAEEINKIQKIYGMKAAEITQKIGLSTAEISTCNLYATTACILLKNLVKNESVAFHKAIEVIRLSKDNEMVQIAVSNVYNDMVNKGENTRNVDVKTAFRRVGYTFDAEGTPILINTPVDKNGDSTDTPTESESGNVETVEPVKPTKTVKKNTVDIYDVEAIKDVIMNFPVINEASNRMTRELFDVLSKVATGEVATTQALKAFKAVLKGYNVTQNAPVMESALTPVTQQ